MKRKSFTFKYIRHRDWCPPDRPRYYIGFEIDGREVGSEGFVRHVLDTLQSMVGPALLNGKTVRVTLSVLDAE